MDNIYELELISRILNSEEVYVQHEIQKEVEKFQNLIENAYKDLIDKGNFPEKAKSFEELIEVSSKINEYIKYSMLIGKTVVGIMTDSRKNRENLLHNIININENKFGLHRNNSLPTIYFNGDESLSIVNKFDLISEITKNDMDIILNKLIYKRKIDLRQSIISIVNSQDINYENIVFILFPSFGDKYSDNFKQLIEMTDFMIVSGNEKINISLKYLENIDYKNNIYVQTKSVENIRNFNLDILEFNPYIIKCNDKSIYNIDFESLVDNILLNQMIYYQNENISLKENILTLRRAMLVDSEESLKSFKLSMEKKLELNTDLIYKLEKLRYAMLEILENITSIIKNATNLSGQEIIHEKRMNELYKRIQKLIECKYYDEAIELIDRLELSNDIRHSILKLKLEKSMEKSINKEDLHKLLNETSKEDYVLKAKIEFRNELNIKDKDAKEIVRNIKRLTEKEEFYLKAIDLKNLDLESSKRFFKIASEYNHEKAKNELYRIYTNEENNIKQMEHLAGLLNKEANYYVANYYKGQKYYKYLFYLKISAALKHMDAIYDLANICFSKRDNDNAIILFDYLVNSRYKENECLLKLGLSYYYSNQNQKATHILEKCHDEKAYFILGKIYEYGEGRMKDLSKAKSYYEKSSNLGNNNARSRYLKVSARLENINEQNSTRTGNYTSSNTYSSYSSSSSSTTSGCFVTTAVCKSLGKDDDCEELVEFKRLRDNYILKQEDGESIISTYYKIAPSIVEAIEKSEKTSEEYMFLWENYIQVCYNHLLNGEYEKVKCKYIEMVEFLSDKYL